MLELRRTLSSSIFLHYDLLFQIKRSKLHEQGLDLGLTWKKIIKFLNEKLEKSKMQSINEDLKDILHAAKQIGIVFFFLFFLKRTSKV